jgi:hypothetical protein
LDDVGNGVASLDGWFQRLTGRPQD